MIPRAATAPLRAGRSKPTVVRATGARTRTVRSGDRSGVSQVRILIVEDELKAADFMRKGLAEQGYAVAVANNGTDGVHLAMTTPFDPVVVGVMLPGTSGWSIVEQLRSSGVAAPVLFVTSRDAVEDRVRGLSLGADDYLVKPFAFSEFPARC